MYGRKSLGKAKQEHLRNIRNIISSSFLQRIYGIKVEDKMNAFVNCVWLGVILIRKKNHMKPKLVQVLFKFHSRPHFLTNFNVSRTLCLIFMILVSLENVKKYSHVVARLTHRLKSTLFEIFSTLRVPFGHPPFEKFSNNVDFSL